MASDGDCISQSSSSRRLHIGSNAGDGCTTLVSLAIKALMAKATDQCGLVRRSSPRISRLWTNWRREYTRGDGAAWNIRPGGPILQDTFQMPQALIGRKAEQEIFHTIYPSKRPELVAIYGRRRVGKTFLVRQFFACASEAVFFNSTGTKEARLGVSNRARAAGGIQPMQRQHGQPDRAADHDNQASQDR